MSAPGVVLVTGAGGGIGSAIAELLAERGDTVLAADVAAATTTHPRIHPQTTDVTDDASVAAAVERAVGLGNLRGVVNCAGLLLETPVSEADGSRPEKVLAVNLLGAMRVVRLAAGHMGPGSAIVNISSIAAVSAGAYGVSGYASSKAGLEGYTRAIACELGPRGIRVNALAPGFIRAPMAGLILQGGKNEERLVRQIPLRRLGEVDDIARAVAFLLSDDAGYVNGTVLTVDGGLRAT